ncbi:hypothetical protein [Gottfriedia acidiceleris]|uniref:Uncharacterized protein n=1 Tax=Gottfriedia acidiceleris TaxID=371036 RepID=A0ABY4JGZ8_9BACI|nr:hypothetical protein [Gottfriedia acidiceleris]UPM53099.1 hypothetical protein MY490_14905 [Gottfriedia acidiceleris]
MEKNIKKENQSNKAPLLCLLFIFLINVHTFEAFQDGGLEKLWFTVLTLLWIYIGFIIQKSKWLIFLFIITLLGIFIWGILLFS